MAELNVERKQGGSVWVWVIALIVVALLAWWLFARDPAPGVAVGPDTALVDPAAPAAAAPGAPNEVNQYIAFVDEQRGRTDMGVQHEHTADGLRRLAAALDALQRDDRVTANVQQHTDSVRTLADALQREEASMQHAAYAQQAFTHASRAMRDLDTQLGATASASVDNVEQAAQRIDAQTALLDQRQNVQQAFDASADALRSLTQGLTGTWGTTPGTQPGMAPGAAAPGTTPPAPGTAPYTP